MVDVIYRRDIMYKFVVKMIMINLVAIPKMKLTWDN